MPEGRKHFNKTHPITREDLAVIDEWWNNRHEIKDEKDDYTACCMNVDYCVQMIEKSFIIEEEEQHGLVVTGAVYQLEDGKVNFDYRSRIQLR